MIDEVDVVLDVASCELLGVRDRRGGADEDRVRPVEGADPPQTTEHVRHVRAEHATIRVELVEDDIAEVLEQLHPLRVVGKDPGVEHVGVRDDHMARAADRGADRGRRVAVVRVGLELDVDVHGEPFELGQLVLGERLRREEVERAHRGVFCDRVDDGEVVAERLAARGRRDDDRVLSGVRGLEGLGLVRVERFDPAPAERRDDAPVEPAREFGV